MEADVPGATVKTVRPDSLDKPNPPPQVNVYLYQVTPNAAWRNADVPTRRAEGSLVQRPCAALDLHYLLSFYGDEAELEPQRLLGRTVSLLHARPVLTRQAIRSVIDAAVAADPDHFLGASDLAEQVELVRFSPLTMSLEELSRIWSVFFQTPYALSVAYQGTVVLIESAETPAATTPVRARGLYVAPLARPEIERVAPAGDPTGPIVLGSALLIQGKGLQGDLTRVRLGTAEATPDAVSPREARITLGEPPFPSNSLRAGVLGAQIIHELLIGTPPTPHSGPESNVVPIVLRPTITSVSATNVQGSGNAPRSADVTVQVSPAVGQRQRVSLLLSERGAAEPAAYVFAGPARLADTSTVTVPVDGVKAATYLVRLQVDGAESLLQVDTDSSSPTFNQYIGPEVTIP